MDNTEVKKMVIAICDDDRAFVNQIQQYLSGKEYANRVLTYSNYDVLQADIQSDLRPDVVLMDIDWKREDDAPGFRNRKENGMVLAELLHRSSPKTKILFVTGYVDRFVSQVFFHEINVLGIMAKPLNGAVLDRYMEKALRMAEQDYTRYLELVVGKEKISLPYSEIRYIESRKHYSRIVTKQLDREIRMNISELEQELTEPFIRCHKSYIVNLSMVKDYRGGMLELMGQEENIPVGRTYRDTVREKYMMSIVRKI